MIPQWILPNEKKDIITTKNILPNGDKVIEHLSVETDLTCVRVTDEVFQLLQQ